jgi:D-glycero-D-manno-heptose 1,7-bisphosphate phosphatase
MMRALLLDRDGVINVDHGYVHTEKQFDYVPGIFDLARAAHCAGFLIVVVTNQAGIGRGYYGEADFHRLTEWMRARFAAEGAPIARVYFCPHHPEAGIARYRLDCFDRKPNPGMILRARTDLGLDLAASAMVGDKESDMEAGRRAGVGTLVLVGDPPADTGIPGVITCRSLGEAASALLARA